MNLTASPTTEQLRSLLSTCDDEETDHLVWVDQAGRVHIDPLPPGIHPGRWDRLQSNGYQFRLKSLRAGNGWTGLAAAADDKWVGQLFSTLVWNWSEKAQGFVDFS